MAYQRLASFRGEASFKTWLLTIAWHQAINRRRSEDRWWRRVADTTRPMTMDAGHESPIDTAVASAFT